VANIKDTHRFEQDALIASVWAKRKRWVSNPSYNFPSSPQPLHTKMAGEESERRIHMAGVALFLVALSGW
jgi:hypothetical protein